MYTVCRESQLKRLVDSLRQQADQHANCLSKDATRMLCMSRERSETMSQIANH